MHSSRSGLTRRKLLIGASTLLATPSVAFAQVQDGVRRNTSSFVLHEWHDHFDSLGKGILLSDTNTRVLQQVFAWYGST